MVQGLHIIDLLEVRGLEYSIRGNNFLVKASVRGNNFFQNTYTGQGLF